MRNLKKPEKKSKETLMLKMWKNHQNWLTSSIVSQLGVIRFQIQRPGKNLSNKKTIYQNETAQIKIPETAPSKPYLSQNLPIAQTSRPASLPVMRFANLPHLTSSFSQVVS
jgi:hypothetical protein